MIPSSEHLKTFSQASGRGGGPLTTALLALMPMPRSQCLIPNARQAAQGHAGCARALVEAGADLNARNSVGMTPCYVAARGGHAKVIRLLARAGVDLRATAEDGASALYVAAEEGAEEVTRALIELGVDKDQPDNDGATALFAAVRAGLWLLEGGDVKKRRSVSHVQRHECPRFYSGVLRSRNPLQNLKKPLGKSPPCCLLTIASPPFAERRPAALPAAPSRRGRTRGRPAALQRRLPAARCRGGRPLRIRLPPACGPFLRLL